MFTNSCSFLVNKKKEWFLKLTPLYTNIYFNLVEIVVSIIHIEV